MSAENRSFASDSFAWRVNCLERRYADQMGQTVYSLWETQIKTCQDWHENKTQQIATRNGGLLSKFRVGWINSGMVIHSDSWHLKNNSQPHRRPADSTVFKAKNIDVSVQILCRMNRCSKPVALEHIPKFVQTMWPVKTLRFDWRSPKMNRTSSFCGSAVGWAWAIGSCGSHISQ